jgi:uncharacterized membrane protein
MIQSSRRDVRVVDAIVVQNLSTSPSFFASTTLLIVGGLLALLGSSEQTSALVSELPFAVRTSRLVLDLKLLLLTGVFVYAFFRFDGLRAYYFAFAAAAWLVSPIAFAVGSAGVVWVLFMREFHSEALALMRR